MDFTRQECPAKRSTRNDDEKTHHLHVRLICICIQNRTASGPKKSRKDITMATIKYTGTVKDGVGRSKDVNLSVAISEKERRMLENAMAGDSDGVQPIVDKVIRQVRSFVFADGLWICFCGCPGKFTHHAPFFSRCPTRYDFNAQDAPFIHCDNRVCYDTARKHAQKFFLEVKTSWSAHPEAYSSIKCQQCMKWKNVKDMFLCSRCKLTFYCSKSCQVLHWKNQHKKDCVAKKN